MAGEGIYAIPTQWPNCTETVWCGPPPEPTVNGSRIWLNQEYEVIGINFKLKRHEVATKNQIVFALKNSIPVLYHFFQEIEFFNFIPLFFYGKYNIFCTVIL